MALQCVGVRNARPIVRHTNGPNGQMPSFPGLNRHDVQTAEIRPHTICMHQFKSSSSSRTRNYQVTIPITASGNASEFLCRGAGLDCIAPEVNRNRNIGEVGANMEKGAFMRYLAGMAFNTLQASPSSSRTRIHSRDFRAIGRSI